MSKYGSYFSQQLFIKFPKSFLNIRISILDRLLKRLMLIQSQIENNNDIENILIIESNPKQSVELLVYSIIYFIEYGLSENEENYLIKFIESFILKISFSSSKNYQLEILKIAESVICSYDLKRIKHIRRLGLKIINELIKYKEGYFFLRGIVKISKEPEYQDEISNFIFKNFDDLIISKNGSLLCQCIIFNFPLEVYIHNKSYMINNDNSQDSNTKYLKHNFKKKVKAFKYFHDEVYYDKSNIYANRLCFNIIKSYKQWINSNVKSLIEFAIRKTRGLFEKIMIDLIKSGNHEFLTIFNNEDIDFKWSVYIIKVIIECFSIKNIILLLIILNKKVLNKKCSLKNLALKDFIVDFLFNHKEKYGNEIYKNAKLELKLIFIEKSIESDNNLKNSNFNKCYKESNPSLLSYNNYYSSNYFYPSNNLNSNNYPFKIEYPFSNNNIFNNTQSNINSQHQINRLLHTPGNFVNSNYYNIYQNPYNYYQNLYSVSSQGISSTSTAFSNFKYISNSNISTKSSNKSSKKNNYSSYLVKDFSKN